MIFMGGAAVVGQILNQCFDRADQLVNNAGNEAIRVGMEGGVEFRRVIELARVVHADILTRTMDDINEAARNTIGQLGTLANQVHARTQETLQDLSARAQQIANTLPLHNDHPQLTSMNPRFVFRVLNREEQEPIRIRFLGNFEHASQGGFEPVLRFGNTVARRGVVGTQELVFEVDHEAIFPERNMDPLRIIRANGTLTVPWPGALLQIGNNMATYHITIGVLPDSPGRIKLKYKKCIPITLERPFKSELFSLSSCKDDGNKDKEDRVFAAVPSDGWHVKRGSASIQMIEEAGRRSNPHNIKDDGNIVRCEASTIYNKVDLGDKESGHMKFHICFTEAKLDITKEKRTKDIEVRWGDTKVFEPRDNWDRRLWKIVFKAFDGSRQEFAGAGVSRYLNIESEGRSYRIRPISPWELRDI